MAIAATTTAALTVFVMDLWCIIKRWTPWKWKLFLLMRKWAIELISIYTEAVEKQEIKGFPAFFAQRVKIL